MTGVRGWSNVLHNSSQVVHNSLSLRRVMLQPASLHHYLMLNSKVFVKVLVLLVLVPLGRVHVENRNRSVEGHHG
jgi:hypothetical protein